MNKKKIDNYLKSLNFNNPAVRSEISEIVTGFDNNQWVDNNKRRPKKGGEYNVVWDLKDGQKPLTTTMDFDAITGIWEDPHTLKLCEDILYWRELPAPFKKLKS